MSQTIYELIDSVENEISNASEKEAQAKREINVIMEAAERDGRSYVTQAEQARTDALFADIERYRAGKRRSEARLAKAQAARDEDEEADRLSRITRDSGAPPGRTASFSVGRNERTYHPGKDEEIGRGDELGSAFLLDVGKAYLGDPLAQDRLTRHQREEFTERPWLEQRAAGTAAFSGLVVPQYVTAEYAPAVAAMRPLADVMNHRTLPAEGMTVNISRITTATSVDIQSSENTAVANQDIDDTLLQVSVQTAAGYVTLSRQAVERGTLTDEVTVADLLKRYASRLDSTLINQATNGLAPVSTSQTYTNATVDTTAIPAVWKQLIQAQNTVETNLLAQAAPSHFVMHPRRWNHLTAAVSSTWPVVAGTNVPPATWAAQLTNEYGRAVRAVLPNGMKITVDGNISTACNGQATTGGVQDHIYAIAADELYLWEAPQGAVMIRAEQATANTLGIQFICYGYFAYTHARYSGASVVVNGTGLATPSFA